MGSRLDHACAESQHLVRSDTYTIIYEEFEPKTTKSEAISLLINSAVGAGVLSFPFFFQASGWFGSLLLLVIVAILECFTLYILSRWADKTQTKTYGELVKLCLGDYAAVGLNIVMLLYLFGSGVAYLIILADSFTPVVHEMIRWTTGDRSTDEIANLWWCSRQIILVVVSITTVLPFTLKAKIGSSAFVSVINFWAFVGIVLTLCYVSVKELIQDEDRFAHVVACEPVSSILKSAPIAIFGLQCHAQVIAVFNELGEEYSKVPTYLRYVLPAKRLHEKVDAVDREEPSLDGPSGHVNSKIIMMTSVIIEAIASTVIGYIVVGLAVYLAFPGKIQSNVLNSFDAAEPVILFGRLIVGILQIASYPVNHFPARMAIQDIWGHFMGQNPTGVYFVYVESFFFFFATLALAFVVHDLGAVFQVVGGTCGAIIILGMPGLILLAHANRKYGTIQTRISESTTQRMWHMPKLCSFSFWAGVGLTSLCMVLFINTLATL